MKQSIKKIILGTVLFGITSTVAPIGITHADVNSAQSPQTNVTPERAKYLEEQKEIIAQKNIKLNQRQMRYLDQIYRNVQKIIKSGKSEYPKKSLRQTLKKINKKKAYLESHKTERVQISTDDLVF